MRMFLGIVGFFLFSWQLFADASVSSPHQLIEAKTQQLIDLVKSAKGSTDAKGYYATNPGRYFKQLTNILDPVVDFSTFTRGVMGRYGTSTYYRSLPTQMKKDAFKESYKRFVGEFKRGLINTYGKGLITFNGQKVEVLPPSKGDLVAIKKGQMVDVVQVIIDKSKKHEIIFKMRPNKHGQWMLRNMIIDDINLGDLYKKQFESAMQKYKGNFSRVVDNWLLDIETTKKTAK